MTGRKWCPTHWLDEAVPVVVDHPSDALRVGAGGGWGVFTNTGEQLLEVKEGDVVEWSYRKMRGRTLVEKRENGTYSLGSRPSGAVTNWWIPGDANSISYTLDELVTDCLEVGKVYEVEAYFWSRAIAFRFEVDGPGRACFEPIARDEPGADRG